MLVFFSVCWDVFEVVVVVVHHHHHHLHLDDFGQFAEFVVIGKVLAEDKMALMMKILDNRQMVVSWLWCQTYVMDQHHNLTTFFCKTGSYF